ncbi:copper resistance system multicopper oxidase [Marinibaculum pumilum]|uniref:Copper resistance system multicopper oxidase n=1 Tax=Marinibaculum pumilum TaxID=1766165 RepID=A0ABV7KX34_9PROT
MPSFPACRPDRRQFLSLAGAAGIVSIMPGRRTFAAATTLDLAITESRVTIDGRASRATLIGGSLPAPTLHWREGEEIVVHATNRLAEPTSIHWHGLLIEPLMDGAPGFNGFVAIPPGETWTYRFRLRQAGTYWYHSHSAMQEQSGMYGAIVIAPRGADPVLADRDHVVLLSDHTAEDPMTVLANLKKEPGYYNRGKRTLLGFLEEADRKGFGAALSDRLDWGQMQMDPTDLADVTGYTFLVNGHGPADNWTGLFAPGERVRLRLINASAMSFFDVRIPGLPMTVVAADGQNVRPVEVDEFRFGVGETYDVIVRPGEREAYTLLAEPLDRSGQARATLAVAPGLSAAVPPPRPRALLSMSDMGHGAMGHGGMDHGAMNHAGMDHGTKTTPPAVDHSKMDHSKMDHAAMGHGPAAASAGDAEPVGWDHRGAPPGSRILDYADLAALAPRPAAPKPKQEITLRLTGMMDRYIWTLNGEKFDHGMPVRVAYGERVRLRFVNETMMAHPMHLHGMFMELENGRDADRPLKHVIIVPPGRSASALLTADEPGEWPLHCHLLYHMASGMMTRFIVERRAAALQGERRG